MFKRRGLSEIALRSRLPFSGTSICTVDQVSGKYAATTDRDANGHVRPEAPLCQRKMKAVLNRGDKSQKRNRANDNSSHD
jgi:hypothetical protein